MRKLQKPWLEFPLSHSIRHKTDEFWPIAVVVIIISQSDSILPQKGDTLGITQKPRFIGKWESCIPLLCQLFSSLVKWDSFSPDHLCILCHFKAVCHALEEYFEQRRAGKIKKEDKFMVLCTQPRCQGDLDAEFLEKKCTVNKPDKNLGDYCPTKATHKAIKASLVELYGFSSRSKIRVSIWSAWQISFKFQPSAGLRKNMP